MLTTFVIGLREGLEAALIVGIIAAFLIQRGERRTLLAMWWGVGAAVAVSLAAAVALNIADRALPLEARELMEGLLAILAVVGITYMIVWMRRHSAGLKGDLESRAGEALAAGSGFAIAGLAFIAVGREGLETAVFLLATLQTTQSPLLGGAGALIGIVVAVGLGYGIYRGAIRIDLSRFFRITGIVLVIVAAGLVASAVHELAEAGFLTVLQGPAVDLSWLIAPGTVRSSLLTAFVGFQPVPTFAELIAWAAFLIPMVVYVAKPPPRAAKARMAV